MRSARFFKALRALFAENQAELNTLDRATGDGDHGATMLRGLEATGGVSQSFAKAFARASGGAAGTLFGVLFEQLEAVLEDPSANAAALRDALIRAAERIGRIGQAKPGDKSMLDPLAAAAEGLRQVTADVTLADGAARAAASARQGADATVAMVGRRGRVRYVEGGGAGHLDPGAHSVTLVLDTFRRAVGGDA